MGMDRAESDRRAVESTVRGGSVVRRADRRRSHFAGQLWKTTALSTLALTLSGVAVHAGQNGLWQPQVRAITGADNNGAKSAIEAFLPLNQTLESVLFLDVRAKHDFDDGFGQDVGLGVRRLVTPDLMIGGYAYLNVQNSNSHQFVASTLGLEAITPNYDAHVNVYLPISGDVATSTFNSTLSLVGNQLMEQISSIDRRDYAAWGIEGEVGVQAPIDLPESHALRLSFGAYHFGDPDGLDGSVTGGKAGFEYAIGDAFGAGTSLVFAGEVREDNRDDTQFAGSVRLTIPLNAPDKVSAEDRSEPVYPVSEGLRKRVNERVRGDIGVRLEAHEKGTTTATRVAIDAATGSAFGSFFFADGGNALGLGTSGDPTTLDDAVANAGANGVIVALGGQGNLLTAGVTLADGQTIIGGGENVTVRLANGGARTFDFGGSNATISGTNPANNVITLANGNTLSGITVTGGADGIFGNNVSGATLTKVTVTGAGGNGAAFTGSSTGIKASDFTATGNGMDGLSIDSDGTFSFTGTTLLSGNGDDGLDIAGQGTYSFATLHAQNNTDAGIHVSGTSVSGSFTTTGGTVSGNGGVAVFIDPITAHVTLDSVSHDGGVSGIVLEDIAGSFTVTGETTVSNTSGAAIAISNSPASIRFGDIEIRNPGSDGMSFAGVNAEIVAGDIVISGLGAGGTGLDFSNSKANFTARSVDISGTGAGSIGIDLAQTIGGSSIVITNGGSIANVGSGVQLGMSGSPAHSANAQFTFGGGSISGVTASLDARGLNQTLGSYAFGSTSIAGPQLFETQNLIFVGAVATGSGTGSSLSDLASIATADANTDANAIFVLVNRGAAIDDADGFSLSAGQTLASFGNGRAFSLGGVPINVTGVSVQQGITISDAGGAATLTNSGGGDTVHLASNTTLLDLNLTGSGNGVYGNGVGNVTLTGLTVSGAALHGLLFDGVNTVSATNLTASGNGGAGISILGNGTYAFSGSTELADNAGNGLLITGDGSYTFQTLNATGNGGSGVIATGTGAGELSIASGTISGNGTNAFSATDFGLDVNLSSLGQTGGATGIRLSGVSGDFAVSGATTISNTASDAIAISNSSATVGFGGLVSIANPLGNGITLNGNSGAVRFGEVAISQPGVNGIDVQGVNGPVNFQDIDISGLSASGTGLDLSGSRSTLTAATLSISGAGGTSTGIDLSGTTGGSVTVGSGVISSVGTGVQMGSHGAGTASANTAFSFGGGSITGAAASLDMRGLFAGSGTYAFSTTALTGSQLFNTANVIFVGANGNGDGSSVNDLINAQDADDLTTDANTVFVLVRTAAGQIIDTDADGFTLADGQSIVSFANGGTVDLGAPPANVTGANIVTGATQADPFGFGEATLNNAAGSAIVLANGNRIENLNVRNGGSGASIDGTGVTGLNVNGVTIESAVTGIDLTSAAGAMGFADLRIQAAQNGIVLSNSGATLTFAGATTIGGITGTALSVRGYSGTANFANFDIIGAGRGIDIGGGSSGSLTFDAASSIANTLGVAFNVDTAAPTLVYDGSIAQTFAASAVRINAMTGGSATFGGPITASTGAANAIDLTGNAGGTINFIGGLNLATDGGFAFSAINGGTLSVAGTGNTVTTGAGPSERGIQLGGASGLTIGAAGVNFSSVTVNGSGGTVSTGILIENTSSGNVTFGNVDISRVNGDAIRLSNVQSGTYTFGGTTTIATVVGSGPGFVVQNSAAAVNVSNLVTTAVSGADISLTNNTGTISIGGSINNSGTGDGVVVSGGSGAITIGAAITSSASVPGAAVRVDGMTGGSLAFSGNITSTGSGNLIAVGATTAPTGGTISFSGSSLTATGGGGAVIAGLGSGAVFNMTSSLSITNATGNGLSVANVAGTATFGDVTVTGSGGHGLDIAGNVGPVTFGTTTVALGNSVNTAGIKFSGANANVIFGTTTIDLVGANQTGIDFSTSATTADFGVTTITGAGDLSSRGIDLSTTSGNKVIAFEQGSRIDNTGVGVELSSGGTAATSANAMFTFGDGDSTDGLESSITAATGGFTVNTVGLDPSLGVYNFDDVSFTGSANFGAANSVKFVSQTGGFIAAGTVGNLSVGVNTISLADADALTGTQTFAFVGSLNLGSSAFTLDSGQSIVSFGNGSTVSTGIAQPVNVSGNLGGPVGNVSGEAAVVTGTSNFVTLLGDNAIRNTTFNFAGATGAAFLIDQGVGGFSNAGGTTIEGVTINNVAAGQTAIKVVNLDTNLSVVNNSINVAGKLFDISGGTGTISVSRGSAGTLTGGGIDIAGRTGGAVTFTDQVTINTGGVSISGGGAGAAVYFNGGLDITTSTATGLSLTGLNALTIANAGSTTIQATGQTALSLQGTIGMGGIAFDSVTSTNAAGRGVLISGANGGSVDLDAVSVTASGGAGIEILNSTGVYTFGNTTIENSTTGGRGINVENAANTTTATFDGTLAIATSTGTGFRVAGSAPASTLVNVIGSGARSVSTTNGTAVDMASASVNANFTSTNAVFAAGNGINLQNLSGTLSLGGGALTNTGLGAAFNVGSTTDRSGGNAIISYAGNIVSNGTGAAVSIQELTGGSATLSGNLIDAVTGPGGHIIVANINNGTAANVTFSGTSKQIQSGAQNGVTLTNNSDATIGFANGGLAITTTSGLGFNATGGGAVTVEGASNTITSATGTALTVVNTTIGSSNLTFRSISSNGALNGIVLNNTGAIGGLTVTGDGGGSSNGSGGTIQNSTGTGVLLNATRSVNLAYMNIANSRGDGIGGTSVTNFTLDRSTLSNNGTTYGNAGIDFDGLFGAATITHSTITTSFDNNMWVRNSHGTLALTITDSMFTNASAQDQSNDGLLVEANGTATISATVSGNTFAANRGDHFQAVASNSGNLNIVFTQNTLAGGHAQALGQGITIAAATGVAFGGYTGTVNYDITDNTFDGAISSAVNVNLGSSGASALFNGFIRNNRIGTVGVAGSGSAQGSGIQLGAHGNGTHTALVTGNTVVEAGSNAMSVLANDGNGVLNLTVQGNQLSSGGPFAREAFTLSNGATSTNIFGVPDSHTVRLNLGGAGALQNTFVHGDGATEDFRIRQRFSSTIILEGYAGTATDTAAVVSYIQNRNAGSSGEPGSATVQAPGAGFLPGAVPLPDPF